MFEEILTPDVDELQKRIQELEDEVDILNKDIVHHRRTQADDWEAIDDLSNIIKKCRKEFGSDKVNKIIDDYIKEKKADVSVDITSVDDDDD